MRKMPAYYCGLLLGLLGCSELEDSDLVKPDDVLVVMVKNEKRELKANGKDQAVILARLPKEAGRVDVSFSTTAGVFLYSNDKSVKELADSISYEYRYARAILRADSIKSGEPLKQVFVTAEIGSSRNRISLTFKP